MMEFSEGLRYLLAALAGGLCFAGLGAGCFWGGWRCARRAHSARSTPPAPVESPERGNLRAELENLFRYDGTPQD